MPLISRNRNWFGSLLLFIGLFALEKETTAQNSLEGLIFRDAYKLCLQAVNSGDLDRAAAAFQQLELTFGSEEEYLSEEAQRKILPLQGLVELGAGQHFEAAQTLENFRTAFPDVIRRNASLLYGLAQAYRGSGDLTSAREVLLMYVSEFAGTAEAGLAFLERADLFFIENQVDEGLSSLDDFLRSQAPESLKAQGRLKAVQACLQDNRLGEAKTRMLASRWTVTTMPELAQLAFSALRCGEFAMKEGDYQSALSLFQLIPPREQLIRMQTEKLDELTIRLNALSRRTVTSRKRHQITYLQTLRGQLTEQLNGLNNSEDYTPGFYLHYGQCLLLDSQFHKAWLVFEYISLNEAYPSALREEAHYRWVVCAHQLDNWEEALTIARNFVNRYPESALAPQALYLIAKSHLEQRRYPESIEVLSDLIERFPDHPMHGRWLFTRGFNHVVLENHARARVDFEAYEISYPQGRLITNAKLWKAQTYFFERNYQTCIKLLNLLLEIDSRQPLYPEILYRLASAHYSAREFDSALEFTDRYLSNFSRHHRVDEASVLKGDILMGLGELDDAVVSFEMVTTESPDLYLYGVFQIGKIFRAQEEYLKLASHLTLFLENEHEPRLRISEALYWLGWAYQQLGEVDKAFPVFEDALLKFGNDRDAAETQSILQALEKLKRNSAESNTSGSSALAMAPDFKSWLTDEIGRSKAESLSTYFSRLVVFYHSRYAKMGPSTYSFLELADLVSLENMDPDALGRVCLALEDEDDPRATTHSLYLTNSFPKSTARAMGYLALARLAFNSKQFEDAKNWLKKSETEVPMHPHLNETRLLLGQVESQLGEYDSSIRTYESLLRLKSARGRPHALALAGIADAHRTFGDQEKAAAFYQRIFNMYRAYPDLVASAYWESAQIFKGMAKTAEAVNTLQEMLSQNQLAQYPEWENAEQSLPEWTALIPESTILESEEEPNE